MRPESQKYLWDALQAGERVARFVEKKQFSDYEADELLRSAVERQFEIIGEALSQLHKIDPSSAAAIPELRRIIAFRNILVHGYALVDDRLVWALWRPTCLR
jgi:uncharacterized protein with HEPN domain